jgi:hypothetical protein
MKQMELDMIVGQRVGKMYEGTPIKKFLRTCLRFFVEFMSDRKIPDINSGLRIFKKEIVLNNPRLLSDRFSFTTSLTLTSLLSGRQVGYIPVPYQKREGKSKVKLLKDSIRTFGLILSVAFYFNPLKVAFPLLIFGTLLSFVGAMAVFFGLEFFIALYILISYLILTLVLLLGLLSHLVSLKN